MPSPEEADGADGLYGMCVIPSRMQKYLDFAALIW